MYKKDIKTRFMNLKLVFAFQVQNGPCHERKTKSRGKSFFYNISVYFTRVLYVLNTCFAGAAT